MIEIDGPRALELLTEAVNDKGTDYVYANDEDLGCQYFHVADDEPGCLVGQALHRAGVSVEQLIRMNSAEGVDIDETSIGELYGSSEGTQIFGFNLTHDAIEAFRSAQWCQDTKMSWGAALSRAVLAVTPRIP